MNVSVTIDLSVLAVEKHWRQIQLAAEQLTNAKESVHVFQPAKNLKRLTVSFTVPKAPQVDIVDRIGREFWNVDDYSDSAIRFASEPRRTRGTR